MARAPSTANSTSQPRRLRPPRQEPAQTPTHSPPRGAPSERARLAVASEQAPLITNVVFSRGVHRDVAADVAADAAARRRRDLGRRARGDPRPAALDDPGRPPGIIERRRSRIASCASSQVSASPRGGVCGDVCGDIAVNASTEDDISYQRGLLACDCQPSALAWRPSRRRVSRCLRRLLSRRP